MKTMKTERICKNGHSYYKSSDCPTCPICEQSKIPQNIFLALLPAPARRALETHNINTLSQLLEFSEPEVLGFHGMGPSAIAKLKKLLGEKGLTFKKD